MACELAGGSILGASLQVQPTDAMMRPPPRPLPPQMQAYMAFMDRVMSAWMGGLVRCPGTEFAPCMAQNGNVYFRWACLAALAGSCAARGFH
jgi:hypothetical protein